MAEMCVEAAAPAGSALPAPRLASAGFTLIELMITVAVVAILAVVAYPSYQSSVQKSRRTEAKAALTEVAQRLERYYTENNSYASAEICAAGATCAAAQRVYGSLSENGHYWLRFDGVRTVSTFTVVAIPQGAQAADACGTFSIDQAGGRHVSGGSETDWSRCW